jgi:hypothetical protein
MPAQAASQDFAAKRAAGAQTAQADLKPFSKMPAQAAPAAASQDFAAKRAAAAQAAQANMASAQAPAAAQKPAGRQQGGGKVAGQLSTAPRAVARRAARAAARAPAAEGIEFHSRFLGMII